MKPKFYLKIYNGESAGAFGIQVFLDSNKKEELFSVYTNYHYDHRQDLFKTFLTKEKAGELDFDFEILTQECYLNQAGIFGGPIPKGKQDARIWIEECGKSPVLNVSR